MVNPLLKFKEDNKLTFKQVAAKLGKGEITTIQLARMTPESLRTKQVDTILIVKEKLGIDLIEYIENG